jgi:phosphoserine aminotransferase
VTDTPDLSIPTDLRPKDGRFGAGPSKVRPEQVSALAGVADSYLGTSHRKPMVKSPVKRVARVSPPCSTCPGP